MTDSAATPLGVDDVEARRAWFRRHWQTNIPFNQACGITVRRWDPDGVELVAPYADSRSAHPGVLHGGVIATLVDTAGTAAVLAGHDFARGSRIATANLSLQYLAAATEDALARAHCLRRGRLVHVATVEVVGDRTGRLLATGQVTATVEGERPGLLGPLPDEPGAGSEAP